MKALFLTEKHVSPSDPSKGVTNSMHNIIGSWECSGLGEYKHLFLDPSEIWSSQAVDDALLNEKYDFAFISPWHDVTCSLEVARKLKGKVAIAWWDMVPLNLHNVNVPNHHRWWDFGEAGVLNVVLDYGSYNFNAEGEDVFYTNTVAFETPQDTRIFKKENQIEELDVSFVGAISSERNDIIRKIQDAGINIWSGGGRFKSNLSVQNYANVHKCSKICLNIQGGEGTIARKGRGFEIAACGKFMLVNHPHLLKGYFEENIDYISFSKEDIVQKIQYYLSHPEERQKIADSLHHKYLARFSPEKFWTRVLTFLNRMK